MALKLSSRRASWKPLMASAATCNSTRARIGSEISLQRLVEALGIERRSGVIRPGDTKHGSRRRQRRGRPPSRAVRPSRRSSMRNGDIYRGDLRTGGGGTFIFAAPGRSAVGLKVDEAHHLLFLAGGA